MKFVLCLCALLLGAGNGFGQDRHLIELSGQPVSNSLTTGRITEVIDARADRTGIGWVQVGLGNVQSPADLKGGVTPTLQQLLGPASPATAPAFALRVHQLSIGEITTSSSETASAEVVVDFLRPRPDGQYELLWRAAETAESRGLDVTSQHPANIAAALRGCLLQFAGAGPATLPAVAVLTAEQVATPLARLEPLKPYPLQTDKERRVGVYHTFGEFQHNDPSGKKLVALSATPRTSAEWAGTKDVELHYVDEQGGRTVVRNVWGYSDGQDLYILYRRRYYLLSAVPGGYIFEAPSTPETEALVTGAALGGIVGMGIAAAASGGHRQEHFVSLLTGRISTTPLRGNEVAARQAEEDGQEGKVVVYRRKPSASVVDVYAGKRVAGGLAADQGSVTVEWTDRRNALRLCLRPVGGSAAEVCVDALPRPGETLYYEYVDGPGAPQLKVVAAKEGAFETRKAELRARQKKD